MLFVVAALLMLITVVLVAGPLLKKAQPGSQSRADFDLAVFKDQLKELEEEAGQGLIDAKAMEAAKLEIERRMLAAASIAQSCANPLTPARRRMLAFCLLLLLPVCGMGVYLTLGSPVMQDQPYIERLARRLGVEADQARAKLDEAARLTERLGADPADGAAWRDLGRAQRDLGRHADGAESLKHALMNGERDPEIIAEMAESQVYAAQGEVQLPAKRAFETVLLAKPGHPKALYFLGLERMQQDDAKGALQQWRRLESLSTADAPWLPTVKQRIAEAEAKLSGKAPLNAQGMPDIGAMVSRLEERMKSNPNDAKGWTMLGRSYAALGDMGKSADAYRRALKLSPDDLDLKQAVAVALYEGARRRDDNAKVPPEAAKLVDEVLKADPQAMDALFMAGQAALDGGDKGKAKGLWSRLLQQLDPNGADHADLKKMIDGL